MNVNQSSLGHEISCWIDAVGPILHESGWNQILTFEGVDVWEALRSPLYISLLNLARIAETSAQPQTPGLNVLDLSILNRMRSKLRISYRYFEFKSRWLSSELRSADVVFWPCEPTHVKVQYPVASALEAQQVKAHFVSSRHKVVLRIDELDVPVTYLSLSRQGKSTSRKMEVLFDPIPALPVFPKTPLEFDEKAIAPALRKVLATHIPYLESAIRATDIILDNANPRAIVVGNDLTPEGRVVCLYCARINLPCVSIMHGNVFGALHQHHIADKFLVFGEDDRSRLIAGGLPKHKTEVTGAPHLDRRPTKNLTIHPRIVSKLHLPSDKSAVLIAMSGPGDTISYSHHQLSIRNIMLLSAKMRDVAFVAKLHRKDQPVHYRYVSKQVPGERLIVVRDNEPGFPRDIYDWLQGISLVITGASTVALEAMLLEIPVVTMDFADELNDIPFINAGATHHVRNFEELETVVQEVLSDDLTEQRLTVKRNAANLVHRMWGHLDGRASERAAESITALYKSYSRGDLIS